MAQQFSLDVRLLQTALYIRTGAVFADVGCDHGYLSIYLMTNRHAFRGYACDISEPSLYKARQNISSWGLEEKVQVIHTNGLQGLEDCGITDVAIAGMGGEMMSQILLQASFLRRPGVRLSLQPMSREAVLRHFLAENGFRLLEETAVRCGGYSYTVLCAEFDGRCRCITPLEAYAGFLLMQTTPEAHDKLRRTATYLEEMSDGMLLVGNKSEAMPLRQAAAEIRHILASDSKL